MPVGWNEGAVAFKVVPFGGEVLPLLRLEIAIGAMFVRDNIREGCL